MPDKIIFLDIETTGLDPLRHEILEVAGIERSADPTVADSTIHFARRINEWTADAKALEVNRYAERKEELRRLNLSDDVAKKRIEARFEGALIVGNNVQFDLRFIEIFLGGKTPWYYAPLDLKAYAAGMCGMTEPASTKFIAELADVPLTKDAHSALADAWWNRNVYDSLVNGSFRKFVR